MYVHHLIGDYPSDRLLSLRYHSLVYTVLPVIDEASTISCLSDFTLSHGRTGILCIAHLMESLIVYPVAKRYAKHPSFHRFFRYSLHSAFNGNRIKVSCIAMGSRDKSLSVWLLPNVDRPLVALYKLFKHSILDFSWNDYHLTICSMDGTIKSIVFDAKELGRLLSPSEMVIF
ncbi:unnamed protein product [Gongylonema pulchrum]|uniref:WD_REPEATS_REGION domain-containing protein n=1 Tax=Gongylonema pulchrum TaxID=637853 RepID=A0A183D1F3_9BILA|nr:unnamed protein product [Gongylonema pulchrum]